VDEGNDIPGNLRGRHEQRRTNPDRWTVFPAATGRNGLSPARCPGRGADQGASGSPACSRLLHDPGDSGARGSHQEPRWAKQATDPTNPAIAGWPATGQGSGSTGPCTE